MHFKHKFDPTILRAYDIRGIINKNLNDLDAFMLGYFFGLTVKKNATSSEKNKIVVSRDGRLSSDHLSSHLIQGLLKAGSHVINIGLNPTPVLYFSNEYFNAEASIQVTGSHNPKEYNGFKMVMFNKSFFDKDIIRLSKFAEQGSDELYSGRYEEKNIEEIYIDRILRPIINLKSQSLSEKTIVWDCGNGATGNIINNLTNKIPGNHHILFSEIDGNFPNHAPDPTTKENLKDLENKINTVNANFGIAFDGDGDRISIMRSNGTLIPGDLLTAFLSLSIKDKTKKIILDIKSSIKAKNAIENFGFKVNFWKTGHSNIKSKMKKDRSLLAGEMSGHIFFSDNYYGFDDAIYASTRFLELIGKNFSVDEFYNGLEESYATPEIKVQCPEELKFKIVKKIILKLHLKYNSNELLLIDGIRVMNDYGWYLIRASNTENALIVRVEGKTKICRNMLIDEVKNLLKEENIFINL